MKLIFIHGSGAKLRVYLMYLAQLDEAIKNASILEEFLEKGWELVDPELKEVVRR
jgi:hypothetical protein